MKPSRTADKGLSPRCSAFSFLIITFFEIFQLAKSCVRLAIVEQTRTCSLFENNALTADKLVM